MRTYLVVIDDTVEARVALRFAARRAAKTGGAVDILAVVEQQEFAPWGGVQAAMEEEARLRAEAMVAQAAGELVEELGLAPTLIVREGELAPTILALIRERPDIAALVLGAGTEGGPGPLATHFAAQSGAMPCPVMLIPGGLDDAALDRMS
jgi:nucleotide-binding universal stress UspA family protein